MNSRGFAASVLVAVALGFCSLAAQQAALAPAIEIREIVPDVTTDTLTIVGEHFGSRVFVTLDLVPIEVRLAINTRVVAAVPLGAMPPGDYLLTISRGAAAGDTASVVIPIGGGAPVKRPSSRVAPSSATTAAPGDSVATVGDRVITLAEVDREWQRLNPGGYASLLQQIYEHRRRIVDQMVATELLAREAAVRGLAPDALVAEEVPRRRIPMPDSAVTSLFQSLGDRARGATLDQMRPALRAWLERNTEPELARMSYVEELMKTSTKAEVTLSPPQIVVDRSPRDPVLGPESAPVEIVVFGDLQSPDYVRLAQAFGRVRETFGDRVRVVFKALPIYGTQSIPVAEAAICAHAQGRFWAFHDAAIKPGLLDAARVTALVAEAGLERERFDLCLRDPAVKIQANAATEAADRSGVSRGPSVIVNGRLAPEAPGFLPTFEYLTRLIEDALQRQSRPTIKGGG